MADKILGNNQVNIYGEVVSEFAFSHEVYGEGFYMVYLSVKRLSQVYDKIPLMVSERLIDITKDYRGMYMEASGQFRSYNRHEENHNRLVLSVFVLAPADIGRVIGKKGRTITAIRAIVYSVPTQGKKVRLVIDEKEKA